MANTHSAIKRIRSSGRKRARNVLVRSTVRTALKNANAAVKDGAPQSEDTVRRAISELDRAAEKGILHKNNVARRKSRLMKKLNAAK